MIGPYRPVRAIAEGGMGRVVEATGPRGERVAIKLLKTQDAAAVARFDRERRLLAGLGEADGFVPLLDAGSSESGPYLVMPLLKGGSLRDRIRAGVLPPEEVRALGVVLAQALGRAHERGIVHRDLKPENILFARVGDVRPGSPARPLIADLGLAKHFQTVHAASFTAPSSAGGTFGYAAPEQIDDMKSAGTPADVFALAATLYECLSGVPPFGCGALSYADNLRAGPPRRLAELGVAPPRGLEEAIFAGLARDPVRRPGDGHAFARALQGGLEPSRRSLLPVAAVGAALVLVVLGLVRGHPAPGPQAPPPPRVPEPPPPPGPRIEDAEKALAETPPRVGDALALAEEILARSPDDARALLVRARCFAARGHGADAIEDVRHSLRSQRLATSCALLAAYAHDELARTKDVRWAHEEIDDLTEAFELDPKNADYLFRRGLARVNSFGEWAKGYEDLDAACALAPDWANLIAHRGWMGTHMDPPRDALPDLDRAIELAPDDPLFRRWRAEQLSGRNPEGARRDCEKILEVTRDDPGNFQRRFAQECLARLGPPR